MVQAKAVSDVRPVPETNALLPVRSHYCCYRGDRRIRVADRGRTIIAHHRIFLRPRLDGRLRVQLVVQAADLDRARHDEGVRRRPRLVVGQIAGPMTLDRAVLVVHWNICLLDII